MDMRVGLLFFLVLGTGWASAARQIADAELSDRGVVISDIPVAGKDNQVQASDEVIGESQACTLCEEYTAQAVNYLSDNATQTEVLDILHTACSLVPPFEEKCLASVDEFATQFFQEVSSVQPEEFCRKIYLCKEVAYISSKFQEDRCGICHQAVSEVLLKLKNPDTQLEIIELLLKACDSMDNYAAKCKRYVFEYGPMFLTNAEQFLETTDICTALHACDKAKANDGEAVTSLKADS